MGQAPERPARHRASTKKKRPMPSLIGACISYGLGSYGLWREKKRGPFEAIAHRSLYSYGLGRYGLWREKKEAITHRSRAAMDHMTAKLFFIGGRHRDLVCLELECVQRRVSGCEPRQCLELEPFLLSLPNPTQPDLLVVNKKKPPWLSLNKKNVPGCSCPKPDAADTRSSKRRRPAPKNRTDRGRPLKIKRTEAGPQK